MVTDNHASTEGASADTIKTALTNIDALATECGNLFGALREMVHGIPADIGRSTVISIVALTELGELRADTIFDELRRVEQGIAVLPPPRDAAAPRDHEQATSIEETEMTLRFAEHHVGSLFEDAGEERIAAAEALVQKARAQLQAVFGRVYGTPLYPEGSSEHRHLSAA